MKKKVVFFDLDDTLYKEIDFLKSAYSEIASFLNNEYHLMPSTVSLYNQITAWYFCGMNAFDMIISTYCLDLKVDDLLKIYRNHIPTISPSCGVKETLSTLKQHSITMGIITDGRTITQMHKFYALGLDEFIKKEDLIISESFGHEKLDGEAFKFVQNKYKDAEYYYIGDNVEKDFIKANELRWVTIGLSNTDNTNIHAFDGIQSKNYLPKYWAYPFSKIINIIKP